MFLRYAGRSASCVPSTDELLDSYFKTKNHNNTNACVSVCSSKECKLQAAESESVSQPRTEWVEKEARDT